MKKKGESRMIFFSVARVEIPCLGRRDLHKRGKLHSFKGSWKSNSCPLPSSTTTAVLLQKAASNVRTFSTPAETKRETIQLRFSLPGIPTFATIEPILRPSLRRVKERERERKVVQIDRSAPNNPSFPFCPVNLFDTL